MANMASVAYAIEGPKEDLGQIAEAVNKAINDRETQRSSEYQACLNLGFTEQQLKKYRLRGDIDDDVEVNKEGILRFYAEECWGLQDFHELLKQKFTDITTYWVVEECGCEVYCTNDKEGKYFPERYWVDTAQDDKYQSEYFETEEQVYEWLSKITNGRVKNKEDVEEFNSDYEDEGTDDENFIYIHKFDVVDDY